MEIHRPIDKNRQKSSISKLQESLAVHIDSMELDEVDGLILRALTLNPSVSQEQLASEIGYSRSGLAKRINKPAFQAELRRLHAGFRERLEQLHSRAISKLGEHLENPDPEISIKAAKVLLISLGKVEPQRLESRDVVYTVRFGDNGELIKTMRPMAISQFDELLKEK